MGVGVTVGVRVGIDVGVRVGVLDGVAVAQPDRHSSNQLWSADITYIPMASGYMYLVAVMDWFSRYVLARQFSNTLDGHFCQVALRHALDLGRPEIFNTDQGVQFTAVSFKSLSTCSAYLVCTLMFPPPIGWLKPLS